MNSSSLVEINSAIYRLRSGSWLVLKGTVSEIFSSVVVHQTNFPGPIQHTKNGNEFKILNIRRAIYVMSKLYYYVINQLPDVFPID
jgi:hypothetical protein